MSKQDRLQGAIGEVNRQLISLMQRKMELMKSAEADVSSGNAEFPGKSYVNYIHALEQRRKPIDNPMVVYQGEPGAYSEMAAIDFFGKNVRTKGLLHFEDTFEALQSGKADYAVLPIENSSTGAIRQVYDLLAQYNYFFVGETTVYVDHNLMALPGTKLSDITTVFSHEQGLFQCEQYLNEHPEWKTVPEADTAGSAKMVAEAGQSSYAAICSSRAAELYGLNILARHINHNRSNSTRFVVVSPKMELRGECNKICISLTTSHRSGSLHDVLTVFSTHRINLLRIESRPIPEHNWEYMFFIEFDGDLMRKGMDEVIHEIALIATDLRILGNFKANLK